MIKLIKSTFYKEEETKKELLDYLADVSVLSMGEQCKKFEIEFAKKQQRKYAVFVTSGSAANLALLQSLLNTGTLKRGDRVGVSALTWATNIMPVIQLGLVPVIIDCELDTLNISPETLKNKIIDIKALFITNVLGFCDDLGAIREMCNKNNVILLEDNCESLGSKVNGKLLGNFGLASTFSFFVGHHMSTIEGGMICTDDEILKDMLLMVRAHGWDRNLEIEKQRKLRAENNISDFFARYTFYDLAYNVRPTEINGFIGNNQIHYWDDIVSKRESNFKTFYAASSINQDIIPLKVDHMDIVSNFAMPIVFKSQEKFKKYLAKFESENVEIRPIIAGDMTSQPFYKKYMPHEEPCANAALIHENGLYFGNNPDLSDVEISTLCQLVSNE